MPITTYAYNKQVNPVTLRETIENSPIIVIGLNNVQINGDNTSVSAIMKDALSLAQEAELSGIVDSHIFTAQLDDNEGIYDKEGKLIVHQSIRPIGMHTYFTGAGDDPTNITDVGNGQHLEIVHKIGEPLSGEVIANFNICNNKSYIYEGYMGWNNVELTHITAEIISNATTFNVVPSGTSYDLFGGYLIIPSANGTIDITSDLGDPHGGLVYMPLSNNGTRSQAFWDADFNTTTNRYENITPNLTGEGEYNLFAGNISLTKFVNQYCLTGRGSQELDSEDAEEIGQGMMLRLTWQQHDNVPDSDWVIGCTVTMHREKTV